MYKVNKNIILNWEVGQPKGELLDEIDKEIFKAITQGHIKYQEDMPPHFKKRFPTLFLDNTANTELKDKFYNRKMALNDIKEIELSDTNLIAGMKEEYSWLIPLFRRLESEQLANYNRLKVLSEFNKIEDPILEDIFKEHIKKLYDGIDISVFVELSNILSRLSHSTSNEIYALREPLANQLLESNNPQEKLNQIENIFIDNHVPTVGKIYSCFEILHPDIHEYDTKETISPVLQRSSSYEKKYIIFQDLIKASLGSNNQSMKDYLANIGQGTNIYYELENNKTYEELTEKEKEELKKYINHLTTLYNQTYNGKQTPFYTSGNELEDLNKLILLLSPNGTKEYKIEDRIISMFCAPSGIRSLKEIKDYMKYTIEDRELKNRIAAKEKLELSPGDFIKGIGDITYLPTILQNGCIANDFLISNTKSDATPLDVDLGRVTTNYGTVKDKINLSCARPYGPIWLVLKNDERFYETRNNIREIDNKRDLSRLEVFSTGVTGKDHYGIRTGFASSEIDYIVVDEYNPKIGLEIVKNGFYIPVSDKDGNIVFTPKDYDQLKEKITKVEILEDNNNYYK